MPVSPLHPDRPRPRRGVVARSISMAMPIAVALAALAPATAAADRVTGELELEQPAGKPPLRGKAFLDRIDNPYKATKDLDPFRLMVVVLEKEGTKLPEPPPQEPWDLLGDSFERPVIAVLPGSEVLIRNKGRGTPTLTVDGKPDLLPTSPLNPRSERGFKVGAAGTVYTISDADTPHLQGTVVVVASPYRVTPTAKDSRKGSFTLTSEIEDGTYAVKIWYRTGWLEGVSATVTVKDGKADAGTIKIPAGLKTAAAEK